MIKKDLQSIASVQRRAKSVSWIETQTRSTSTKILLENFHRDLFFYLSKSSIIWVVLLTFNRSKKSKKCVKNRNSEEFTQPLSQKKPCFQNFHVDLFFCLSKSSIIWVDSTGVSIFVVILVELTNTVFVNSTNIDLNIKAAVLSTIFLFYLMVIINKLDVALIWEYEWSICIWRNCKRAPL